MAKCSFLRANEVRALAQDNMLLWREICGIQTAILEASSPCNAMGGQLEVIVKDGTPMTWVSGIQSVTVTNGGTGYEPVVAQAVVTPPPNAAGTNAVLTPIITAGVVTGFSFTNNGSRYSPAVTTLSVNPTVSVNGTGAVLDWVIVDGAIAQVTLHPSDASVDYQVGDQIVATNTAGIGTGFVAAVTDVDVNGSITAITIASNGTGYETVFSTIEIVHPTGAGFEGVVQTNVDGEITGISIQNPGGGYYPLMPTVYVVDNGATGTGAVLEITEADVVGGVIQDINVVQGGFGYSQNVDVIITPAPTSAGADATATATVTPDPNNYGPISPLYYAVLSGQSSDRMKTMQIEFVTDYFTALGYNIRPQVNPQTGNTLQWWVIW